MEFKNVFMQKKYKKPKYNVLFLHGFISSHKIFKKIFDKISIKSVNYYAFDYSDTVVNKKSKLIFDKLHEQVINFVDHYKLDNLILVGHSMGGGVLSDSYFMLKDKVKKVILISPLSKAVLRSKCGLTFFNGTITNNIKKIRSTLFSRKNEEIEYSTDPGIYEDYENFLKEKNKHIELGMSLLLISKLRRVMKGYSTIECPALFLLGEDDKIIPGKIAYDEFNRMKKENFEIVLWKNIGHVSWIENFEQFQEKFVDFIQKDNKKIKKVNNNDDK